MKEERLPLVDASGRVIGSATRRECHTNPVLMHPVIHLHVFDSSGRICLQKRAMTKDLLPGFWDTSVGGHVCVEETPHQALAREAKEELGIEIPAGVRSIAAYIWHGRNETEYVYSYIMNHDGPLRPDPEEIDEISFFSVGRIRDGLGKGFFTPNFEHEFLLLEKKGFCPHPDRVF